jgi:hypothetical protein
MDERKTKNHSKIKAMKNRLNKTHKKFISSYVSTQLIPFSITFSGPTARPPVAMADKQGKLKTPHQT